VALAGALVACTAAPTGSPPSSDGPSSPAESSAASTNGHPSLSGRIIYSRFSGNAGWESDFLGSYIIQTDGSGELPLPTPNHADTFLPNWSPDGMTVSVTVFDPALDIFGRPAVLAPDGSGFTMLETPGLAAIVQCSDWSPDGAYLLCAYDDDERPQLEGIYEVGIDDLSVTRLTEAPYPSVVGTEGECGGGDYGASYSPDGAQFAFIRMQCGVQADPSRDQRAAVWVGNSDGTGLMALTPAGMPHSHGPGVAWSPDGRWILFGDEGGDLNLVAPDLSGLTTITLDGPSGFAHTPTWSPDGQYILFSMFADATGTTNLYIARPDGFEMRQVTTTLDVEAFADWGP
jgi:Tol biopolymer transport system component